MKLFLFVIAFLSSICCFSQVNEDFSDGDFIRNPAWWGDTDKFVIDKKQELRLNDTSGSGGNAKLLTSSSLIRETTWELYAHLFFNPSSNNYAVFYLALSEAEPAQGYCLMIGGETDCISLCRIDNGGYHMLLSGRLVMKGIASPQLKIKVECDKEGNWTLWSCLLNNETKFTEEGKVTDTTYTGCASVGLECVYTASRSKAFSFDNIKVYSTGETPEPPDIPDTPDPDPDDRIPPQLVSLMAVSDSCIRIKFDEQVIIDHALFYIDNKNAINSKTLADSNTAVELILTDYLTNNQEYMINMEGIKDLSGNVMPAVAVGFTYYDSSMQAVSFADVVFSEIMANPKGAENLPEAEYVELHNRKEYPINIKGWNFFYGDKAYPLPECFISPGGYVVICDEKDKEVFQKMGIAATGIHLFPTLSNTGKLLYLEDARSNLVAWVDYSDAWYKDDFRKQGGFSLECIDVDNLSGNAENWCVSVDPDGGTPGEENSIKSSNPDVGHAEPDYCYMQSADTLVIHFTKPMGLFSLVNEENYHMESGIGVVKAVPWYPKGMVVSLVLSSALQNGEEIDLDLTGLLDISGHPLEGNYSVKTGLPQEAAKGDILFNELLFNPCPEEDDFVELFNKSDKYILLSFLRFASRKDDGSSTEAIRADEGHRVFPPRSYLCFTKKAGGLFQQYDCCKNNIVQLDKLLSLPDDKGNILLLNGFGDVLDEFGYKEQMHNSLLDNREGVSLEKLNPLLVSDSPSNWLSASSASGGATPGCVNSQYRELGEGKETVTLEKDSFSPNGDGVEDELLIRYSVETENYLANIKIFDSSGNLVYVLADKYRLSAEGWLCWDGQGKGGNICPIGIYIVYVEFYNPQGASKRYKLACALTN